MSFFFLILEAMYWCRDAATSVNEPLAGEGVDRHDRSIS
jgi:hypothetical protein